METILAQDIKKNVRVYIEANLVKFDEVNFLDSDNIFAKGFVNSLFAMKLLNHIESQFDIHIDDEDIEISNFSSIDNIIRLISKKKQIVEN